MIVVAVHAVVLPVLYYRLEVVVRRSHMTVFVQHVRTLTRNLAEELELGDALDSRQRVVDMLDLTMLNGDGTYAVLIDNGHEIRGSLNTNNVHWSPRQDFDASIDRHRTYFVSLPISRPGHTAELRLGFDKQPMIDEIDFAMQQTFWALLTYLLIISTVAVAWSYRLSQPVVQLQRIARQIAGGDYARSLRLRTGIRELHDLGGDLENMRKELVGMNERLRAEMQEREHAEERHRALEVRFRHRQRLETVGTLAGGVAHEFNNVLLPILLFTEAALAETPENSPAHQDLKEILTAACRAKEVVDKILMFSRDAGAPQIEWIDLAPVVQEAAKLFDALIPSTVELRIEASAAYPRVRADAALTVQLIMNLCTNAYQALRGGVGVVTVSLSMSADSAQAHDNTAGLGHLVLTVSDTGHGMDPATIERMFEPFFTTREVGLGNGLGLSVVHGIAESFGATIMVDSEVGRGTTVRVLFPVREGSPHGAGSAANQSLPDATMGVET